MGILGVLIKEGKLLRSTSPTTSARSGFRPTTRRCEHVPRRPGPAARRRLRQPLPDRERGRCRIHERRSELATLLAAQAAVAIDNARLYESATRWLRQLESLNEVGNALLSEIELPPLLALIAGRLRELASARLWSRSTAAAGRRPPHRGGRRREAAQMHRHDVSARARSRRASANGGVANGSTRSSKTTRWRRDVARRMRARSALLVPLLLRERAIGVITVVDKIGPDPRFSDDDLRLAEAFAGRAAAAVDLSGRVARDVLRRVVAGQELERTRLARELHDETGQALTSILLGLRTIQEADDVAKAVDDLRELVVSTLQNVRRLAVELACGALDDSGLVPALERLTATVSGRAAHRRSRARSSASAAAGRGRDRALPHRAGSTDQRDQARRRRLRQCRPHPHAERRDGSGRGRRPRHRPARRQRHRARGSDAACVNGSRCSTAG